MSAEKEVLVRFGVLGSRSCCGLRSANGSTAIEGIAAGLLACVPRRLGGGRRRGWSHLGGYRARQPPSRIPARAWPCMTVLRCTCLDGSWRVLGGRRQRKARSSRRASRDWKSPCRWFDSAPGHH